MKARMEESGRKDLFRLLDDALKSAETKRAMNIKHDRGGKVHLPSFILYFYLHTCLPARADIHFNKFVCVMLVYNKAC